MKTHKRKVPLPVSVMALALGAFAIGTESFVIAGILPELARDLGVTVPVAGQLVTAFSLAFALAAPSLSVLTGGVRRDLVLKLAMAGFAAANVLAALAPTYKLLLGTRILLAVSAALYMPTASAHAAAAVEPAHRGRALATVYAGMTAALVLGVPIGTLLAHHFGWRSTFVAVALLALAAFVGLAALVARQPAPPRVTFASRLAVLGRPGIGVALGVTTVTLTGVFTVYTYLAELLRQTTGISGDRIGIVLLVFGVGGAAGNIIGGWAADRMPRTAVTRILLLAIPIFVALSLATGLPRGAAAIVIPVLVGLWGVVGWSFGPANQARLVGLAGPLAPIALSFNASAVYAGISLGSVLGSLIVAYGSVTWLGWAAAGCLSLAALASHHARQQLGGAVAPGLQGIDQRRAADRPRQDARAA